MAEPKDTKSPEGAKPEDTKAPKGKTAAKPAAKKPAAKKPAAKKTAAKPKAATKAKTPAKPKTTAKPKAKPKEEKQAPAPLMVRASARYVRVAPRKARHLADQIRGLPIDDARSLLRFSPRGAARDVSKLLDSAAANAENNHDLIADDLKITEIHVDEGPTLKRYRPRARGRATPIHKRTSHISLALTPEEDG
ncbi:MAG: 50S ribosomal protein L22 [Solirubrobacterales bacterium]